MNRTVALHAGLGLWVVVTAWVVAGLLGEGDGLQMARLGVALCGATGAVSLTLKGLVRTVKAGLAVMALVFGARALLMVAGAVWAARAGGGAMPFVWGFFGTYFPLQWVEISFLVSQAKAAKANEQTER